MHGFALLTFVILNNWRATVSQVVTRYLDDVSLPVSDMFPNPDASCTREGCSRADGYKECFDCCNCRCNYGCYWSARKSCLDYYTIAERCKYTLGKNQYARSVTATSSAKLGAGETISYCQNEVNVCATKAESCVIDRKKTFYENNGWKMLWPKSSDIDFEVRSNSGASDSIVWKRKGCNTNKYDGLLISLRIICKVAGLSQPVPSCFVLKVAGSYKIGSNPLSRENCSTTTPLPPTTSATTTAATTTATTGTAATTTAGTTTSATTTAATTATATTMRETKTISKPPEASSTSAATTTQRSSKGSFTSTVITSSIRSAKFTTGTVTGSSSTSSQPEVLESTHQVTTGSSEMKHFTKKFTSTVNANGLGAGRKGSQSKKIVITAASLSSAALLLSVFIAIAIYSFVKRRRRSLSSASSSSSGHIDHRFDNPKELIISNPLPLHNADVLPVSSYNEPSTRFWTIDEKGEFVVAEKPPVYTVHLKGVADDIEDDIYDEPISRSRSSVGKLYAVVNKQKRAGKKEDDDEYSSIEDISMPSIVEKNIGAEYQGKQSEIIPENIITDQCHPRTTTDPIYDEPEMGIQGEEDMSEKNEPVYMLYEPLPERRKTGP